MSCLRLLRFSSRFLTIGQVRKPPCTWCGMSTQIAMPVPDSAPKNYAPKIQNLVSEISKLTVLEVSELNELLKKTLQIPDAPVMGFGVAAGVSPTAGQAEEEKEEKVIKSSYAVKLIKYDDSKKVQLIKEMKNVIQGMNLVQAKKFVESLPQIVKADIPEKEAKELAEAITKAGGQCEIE